MKHAEVTNNIFGVIIGFISTLLVVTVFEICLRVSHVPPYQWDLRLMFFSEGKVFQNESWGGFVYDHNARIHSLTYYITELAEPKIAKEYEYDIITNSSGLVQLNDIEVSKSSILFLGNSYTEGQGAPPWFYKFESHWPRDSSYQVINGGIQGTGIEAWEQLYKNISSGANISKLVVIFISDDWTRSVWQISEQWLECLRFAARCDGSDVFLGLPDDPTEAEAQIVRISRARVGYLAGRKKSLNILESSEIYKQLVKPAFELWRPPSQPQFEKNAGAALRLANVLGRQNVLFVHMPQKDELSSGPNPLGRRAVNFIRQNGLLFVNGFEKCPLTIVDFHQHDGHPNADGYAKMEKCIDEFVKKAFDLSLLRTEDVKSDRIDRRSSDRPEARVIG